MRSSPTTVVVAIVGVGNAVMVSVAPGTTLIVAIALALIAIRNAVAVAIPTARHEPPLPAAAEIHALPQSGHVTVAPTRRDVLAASPYVAVVHQDVVGRRPDIARPYRRHRLINRRRWRRADHDVHLRGCRRQPRTGHRRAREHGGGGKGRQRNTLQHDLPPSGTRLLLRRA